MHSEGVLDLHSRIHMSTIHTCVWRDNLAGKDLAKVGAVNAREFFQQDHAIMTVKQVYRPVDFLCYFAPPNNGFSTKHTGGFV